MKKGNHPFIDPIKVFRHHYGDDAFDTLENILMTIILSLDLRYEDIQVDLNLENKDLLLKIKKHQVKHMHTTVYQDEIDAEIELIDSY